MTSILKDVAAALRIAKDADSEFGLALALCKVDRWETARARWPALVWDTYRAKIAADETFRQVYRESLR